MEQDAPVKLQPQNAFWCFTRDSSIWANLIGANHLSIIANSLVVYIDLAMSSGECGLRGYYPWDKQQKSMMASATRAFNAPTTKVPLTATEQQFQFTPGPATGPAAIDNVRPYRIPGSGRYTCV